ncbi:GntR family transcriptional regulator [Bordetella petrii]|uniref:GntR family transcriptional regulator n=1 Tax=Bordetella petrii TaxID=94624 RepID=UPI001E40320D|nr:GntR family transcriptional regulator [Bordetella petrii]MCD0504214.1 GntR family transcriptional regulator [Bordetella petrii]
MATTTSSRKRTTATADTDAAPARKGGRSAGNDLSLILRERIAKGDLSPGSKLNEYDLAAEFNIPRTRVRDAFVELEQRGLIERTPNRGAMVARLGPEQVFRIYDIREVLEGLCVRLATLNTQPDEWKELYEYFLGPVTQAVKQGNFELYTDVVSQFRARCIVAADNPELTRALDSIHEKTQVLIRRIVILPGRAEAGVRQQCEILKAMCEGNADRAEEMRRQNIKDAKACLKQYLKYIL